MGWEGGEVVASKPCAEWNCPSSTKWQVLLSFPSFTRPGLKLTVFKPGHLIIILLCLKQTLQQKQIPVTGKHGQRLLVIYCTTRSGFCSHLDQGHFSGPPPLFPYAILFRQGFTHCLVHQGPGQFKFLYLNRFSVIWNKINFKSNIFFVWAPLGGGSEESRKDNKLIL